MFQLDEKIKVFTTLRSFDKARFAKTFNFDEANIDSEKIDGSVEHLKQPAWFVKKNLSDKVHFDLSSLSAKDEYFFTILKLQMVIYFLIIQNCPTWMNLLSLLEFHTQNLSNLVRQSLNRAYYPLAMASQYCSWIEMAS